MQNDAIAFDWDEDQMLQIVLPQGTADDVSGSFLKVRETLSRIGIASRKDNRLTQSCHIFHHRGKYYLMHFKEFFALDGKNSTITVGDIHRRNVIATLLEQWNLAKIVDRNNIADDDMMRRELGRLTIIPYKEKNDWEVVTKYQVGHKRH